MDELIALVANFGVAWALYVIFFRPVEVLWDLTRPPRKKRWWS